jgi:hypothetical protein
MRAVTDMDLRDRDGIKILAGDTVRILADIGDTTMLGSDWDGYGVVEGQTGADAVVRWNDDRPGWLFGGEELIVVSSLIRPLRRKPRRRWLSRFRKPAGTASVFR